MGLPILIGSLLWHQFPRFDRTLDDLLHFLTEVSILRVRMKDVAGYANPAHLYGFAARK